MAQETQNAATSTQVPALEFDVRTGQPITLPKGVRAKVEVVHEKVGPKPTPKRGMWLSNKFNTLYSDPKYKTGTAEQQKHWKELAYEKWVIPYYKNILKADPPPIEYWTDLKKYNDDFNRAQFWQNAFTKDKQHGLSLLKETAHILGGIQDDLAYVGKGIDWIMSKNADRLDAALGLDKELRESDRVLDIYRQRKLDRNFDVQVVPMAVKRATRKGPIESFYGDPKNQPFRDLENYYEDRIENLDQSRKKNFVEKVSDKIPGFITDSVFFEATGGRKAATALRIAYPKTAGFIAKRALDSLNGAVDFALWNKTTGESGVEGAKWGALFGPVVSPIFNALFKFGGAESLQKVITDATEQLSKKTETSTESAAATVTKPETQTVKPQTTATASKVEVQASTLKPTPHTFKATQVVAEAMDSYAKEKFKRPYSVLPYIQKVHVLNKVLAEAHSTVQNSENISPEIIQAASKEEREMVESIFPEAKKAQQNVDNFVKQHSNTPLTNKFLATLPHHNTSVDSGWKQLQARASFLKGRLRTAKDAAERKAITAALDEEYAIQKEKAERERVLKAAAEGQMRAEAKVTNIKTKESFETEHKSPWKRADLATKADAIINKVRWGKSVSKGAFDAMFERELNRQEEESAKVLRQQILEAAREGKFRAEASTEGRTVGLPDYTIKNAPEFDKRFTGVKEWEQDSFAKNIMMKDFQRDQSSPFAEAIQDSFKIGNFLSRQMFRPGAGHTKLLYHPNYGVVGAINFALGQGKDLTDEIVEAVGNHPILDEKVLYVNYLGMRPNVVARVWDVPGGGQSLFLNAAQIAEKQNMGMALRPYDQAKKFYLKMGMEEVGNMMVMTAQGVKRLLQDRGLLMTLLAAGISYGASQFDKFGNFSVQPRQEQ